MENRILFLGDAFLKDCYDLQFTIDGPFIFNLEFPISIRGNPAPDKICLRAEHDYIEATFKKKPIAVCLANNHIMDYGLDAFKDTVNLLNKKGIGFFGAGGKKDNYNNPLFAKVGSHKIAFLGYCRESTYPSPTLNNILLPAPIDKNLIINDIKSAKKKSDLVVVNLHWGIIACHFPEVDDINLAKLFIDFGADIIVGHHSHVIQPVINHKSRPIAFGLGNFIFPDLDLSSYFDTHGKATRVTSQKQPLFRRSSVGLSVNLTDFSYNIVPFVQKNQKIQVQKNLYHWFTSYRWLLPNENLYRRLFPLALKAFRYRTRVSRKVQKIQTWLKCLFRFDL